MLEPCEKSVILPTFRRNMLPTSSVAKCVGWEYSLFFKKALWSSQAHGRGEEIIAIMKCSIYTIFIKIYLYPQWRNIKANDAESQRAHLNSEHLQLVCFKAHVCVYLAFVMKRETSPRFRDWEGYQEQQSHLLHDPDTAISLHGSSMSVLHSHKLFVGSNHALYEF